MFLKTPFSLKNKSIYIAGHRGMVGSALIRRLQGEGCTILTNPLDLRRQSDVEQWFTTHKPDITILAAAKVGGILANRDAPADFFYDNLMIQNNVIHAAATHDVEKLLFLGSSCIYPKAAPQPITEDALLTGALEPTNQAYALAKIAGLKLCESYRTQKDCDFISAMPCNLYGPNDRFDPIQSHVIPALMMKIHEAKEQGTDSVQIWGSGSPLREFLHVDDLANGLIFLLKNYSAAQHINIGSGKEITIRTLAETLCDIIGFSGALNFDTSKPDGTPRKIMDNTKIQSAGWKPNINLRDGLTQTYQWFKENHLDA
ncbi:MAG: GDP-L-fucose synthase family protein [Alphaproteobacteria bacterium]